MDVVPGTAVHPLPDGEVRLLGAVREVTGAMTAVTSGHRIVLVDCGVPQGKDASGWSLPDAARDADAVLLTHAHQDHIGGLPALLDCGWDRPVVSTRATFEIARIVLRDGAMVEGASEGEAERLVRRLSELHRPVRYGEPWELDGVTVALREAGHILGSASVEVVSRESRVIVSGDLGRPDTPILRTYHQRWSDARPVDVVVMESTYGDRDHTHGHDAVREELLRVLRRAREAGGHILVPAFAIGRTQILLYHLNALIEEGRLEGLPVVLDSPLGLQVTETYGRFRELYDREALERVAYGDDPLDFDSLYASRRGKDSVRLRDLAEPAVVIASSGMCTGGRIVGHLAELLPREETCVLFVGYQAHGTTGRAILEAAQQRGDTVPVVQVDGEEVEVRARVEVLSGLSAHADRGELEAWLDAVPGVRRVALHHGEPDSQEALAAYLSVRTR